MSAVLLGGIVGLFVQRQPLKRGKAPLREYCTDDLLSVPAITVDMSGVIGETASGDRVLDVHHRDHPVSRDRKGAAGLSFMATGDYQRLRDRYGPHLVDGSAGCTLLIDHPGLAGRDLTAGVLVRGQAASVALQGVQVADPCVEFSRFCLGLPPSAVVGDGVRRALLDLDNGARGYKGLASRAGRIRIGDGLWNVQATG